MQASAAIGGADLGSWQKAAAHGFVGGISAEIQGGEFGHGFASSFLTVGIKESVFEAFGIEKGDQYDMHRNVVAASLGGISAAIIGGDVGLAAITAGIQNQFNYNGGGKNRTQEEWLNDPNFPNNEPGIEGVMVLENFIPLAGAAKVAGGAAATGSVRGVFTSISNWVKGFFSGKVTKGGDNTVDVYRAFGGDSRAQGFSWTTKDPRKVDNFRDAAGLPSGGESGATNTADFLLKGRAKASDIIESRPALPLDGNKGGLPELIIDPKNVKLTDFSVLKP